VTPSASFSREGAHFTPSREEFNRTLKAAADRERIQKLGLRRRIPTGTRVESRTRSVCDGEGHRRWARGVVVSHDPSLDLPLVVWDDERGLSPEAVEDHEYEVER